MKHQARLKGEYQFVELFGSIICTMGFIAIEQTTIWENIFFETFSNHLKQANPR